MNQAQIQGAQLWHLLTSFDLSVVVVKQIIAKLHRVLSQPMSFENSRQTMSEMVFDNLRDYIRPTTKG